MKKKPFLGVNIDHVATLRQARGTSYPDPITIALLAIEAGADSITAHLREDRRHIQDKDIERLKSAGVLLNLEMAVTEEMLQIAERVKPEKCCLVPEKRAELTTEGGLNVAGQEDFIHKACLRLAKAGIEVSLFIDVDIQQIMAAKRCEAPVIEFSTGAYADAENPEQQARELAKLQKAAEKATQENLIINAGHGLHYENVQPIALIPNMNELNIGHSIISFSVFWGITEAVQKMKQLLRC
jgi:pyridoxine 5-phosphate synthase